MSPALFARWSDRKPFAALALPFACLLGCGGSVATSNDTPSHSVTETKATPELALFAHFEQAPSFMLMGGDYVYVATKKSRMGGALTDNGAVWAVSKASGQRFELWADRFGAFPTALARSNGELVVALSDGRLFAMPERGGESRPLAQFRGAPTAIAATGTTVTAVLTDEPHELYMVGLGDGVIRTKFMPDASIVSLTATASTTYVGLRTESGGRVLSIERNERAQDTTHEVTTPRAPCGLSASPAGLIMVDGTSTLQYWQDGGALTPFASELPTACAITQSDTRVFWGTTAPSVRAQTSNSRGVSSLLSQALTVAKEPVTRAPAQWVTDVTSPLEAPSQTASDKSHVYLLLASDVVRVESP